MSTTRSATVLRSTTRLLVATALLISAPVRAVDGVVEINQAAAAAGSVTPGDTPDFPVTISVPGSYRLTGALQVDDEDTTAIEITASHVTLDLNGFEISGPNSCTGTPVTGCTFVNADGYGVIADTQTNLEIRNGTIRGMGGNGIRLSNGEVHRVIGIRALENGSRAIELSTEAVVSGCHVHRNRFDGIYTQTHASIDGNFVSGNGGLGIRSAAVSVVSGNSVLENDGDGIETTGASRIVDNLIDGNTGFGINSNAVASGYSQNVIRDNSGGTVSNGVEFGTNLCDGDTTCP